jgi:heme/copper-type cytochrome/quinol oxidase subunit 2
MLSGIPTLPEQASTLYFFITAVAACFALLVVVFATVFGINYLDPAGDKVGKQIQRSISLEIGWSIIPFLISMVIFTWATMVCLQIVRAPDQPLEVFSTGKR